MFADTMKIACFLVCVVIVNTSSASPAPVQLPKGFVQCKKTDPEVGECLRSGLQIAIPHLVKGVPAFGLLTIDPLRITELGIEQGSGPVSIKLNFRDLDILNIGTMNVNKIYADVENNNYTLLLDFNKPIIINGKYNIKGKVIVLPITGDGLSKIVLENLKVKVRIHLNTVKRKGITYYNIKDFLLSFTTTKLRIKLDNLFRGDKALGNNMNTFLNENWSIILSELQENFENALGAAIASISKEFLARVPANQLLLD